MYYSINVGVISVFLLFLIHLWAEKLIKKDGIIISYTCYYFALGFLIISLPLTYTSDIYLKKAIFHVLSLLLGIFIFFAIQQLNLTISKIRLFFYITISIGILQSCFAIMQFFSPDNSILPLYGNRVYGFFFQPNLLSSYLALSMSLCMLLCLHKCFFISNKHTQYIIFFIHNLVLMLMAIAITLAHSRAGWLGVFFSYAMLVAIFIKKNFFKITQLSLSIFSGVIIGCLLFYYKNNSFSAFIHSGSNNSRWSMLVDTINMYLEKPFFGWGYGAFEYNFQHYRVSNPLSSVPSEIASHPHNELLFWMVEGGLIPIVGFILMFYGLISSFKKKLILPLAIDPGVSFKMAIFSCLMPIIIHMQFEFPLYISSAHFITFFILLAIFDGGINQCKKNFEFNQNISRAICFFFLILSTLAFYSCIKLINDDYVIRDIEKNGLSNISRLNDLSLPTYYLRGERVDFDVNVNHLLQFNKTHELSLLTNFSDWAQGYLLLHIDKNVYSSLIKILAYDGDCELAKYHYQSAIRFFGKEPFDSDIYPCLKSSGK